ncbi:DUF6795 domain-containing protein [Limnobacter sp.]|uniref:DUF6795 domain-containing protein n=1 Tax=Limnobacter sp. TaxID=2003368 RepID=UPI002E349EA2|nr:DUF6795 domain-containing protein [Limnobacter sp.]
MFFKENIYCSPVRGRIVSNGEPLSGLIIERRILGVGLHDSKHQDQTKTDGQGNFSFPIVKNRTLFQPSLFASATLIDQRIRLIHNGHTVLLWDYTKSDFESSTDANSSGSIISLNCDLAHIHEPKIPGALPFVKCNSK